MRMRVAFLLIVVLATAAANAEPLVLLHRFDVTFNDGPYSALCVVPQTVTASSGARFVCFYLVPGQPKYRDDTDGVGPARLAGDAGAEMGFNDWLRPRLPGAAKCDLVEIGRGATFPTALQLRDACRVAAVTSGILPSQTPRMFIDDVRKAAASFLPTTMPQPAATATVAATDTAIMHSADISATTSTGVASSSDTTGTTSTIETSTTDTGTTDTAQNDTSHTDTANTGAVTDTSQPGNPARSVSDLETRSLLFLITILVTLMGLERLWHAVRRWNVRKHAFEDELASRAASVGDAAVLALKQRDALRKDVNEARKKAAEAEVTIASIDRALELGKGETRAMRIETLVSYEKQLLRISNNDSPLGAFESIKARLKQLADVQQAAGRDAGNIVEYVRDCTSLMKALDRPFWSRTTDPASAPRAVREVADEVHRLFGGGSERSAGEEIASIDQSLRRAQEQAAERQRTIDEQKTKLDTAQRFLIDQWPAVVAGEFGPTVGEISTRMRLARAAASKVDCAAEGNADALVTELVTLVQRERNAARGAHEILRILRDYLMLPEADAVAVSGVVAAESGKPHRVLRLALAAAIPELRNQLERVASDEDARVMRMLRIGEIVDELEGFLARLWTYEGDRLWSAGIHSGFAQSWLHYLFRAEAVLRTYFAASTLASMGDALTFVAWAFRHAITASGYDVDRVQLLDVPTTPMASLPHSFLEFRTCPDIRNRVQAVLKTQRDGGFAVDFESVGIRDGDRVLKVGSVVLANRVEWED